jgi:hypothetical protein
VCGGGLHAWLRVWVQHEQTSSFQFSGVRCLISPIGSLCVSLCVLRKMCLSSVHRPPPPSCCVSCCTALDSDSDRRTVLLTSALPYRLLLLLSLPPLPRRL